MIGELSQYLVDAPLAVIVLIWIYFSDRSKNALIKSIMKQNDALIEKLGKDK